MKSRAKDLGTRLETATVDAAQAAGLAAERLAEGGSKDLGDVRIWGWRIWAHKTDPTTVRRVFVVECKDRMALNIHEALAKAIAKGGRFTVVKWRRMARKPGNTNRTQVGEPIIAMSESLFLELIGGAVDVE